MCGAMCSIVTADIHHWMKSVKLVIIEVMERIFPEYLECALEAI